MTGSSTGPSRSEKCPGAQRTGRGRDHLEVLWPEGTIVVGVTGCVCVAAHGLAGGGALVSFSLMTLAFLVVFQAGWRCLYGFAKAHDSLVPKPVQRRLEAQEARDRGESDGTAGSD